jgi:hypothetical protein
VFLRDVGRKPPGTRLEQCDKAGMFTASNCEWRARPAHGKRRRRRR